MRMFCFRNILFVIILLALEDMAVRQKAEG